MIYGTRHVESALRRLEQGGRVVAIASEAMGFTRPAFSDWWKVLAKTYNVRANFHLSGNDVCQGLPLRETRINDLCYGASATRSPDPGEARTREQVARAMVSQNSLLELRQALDDVNVPKSPARNIAVVELLHI